ncbi:hypothetical protein BC332_18894 [Capsicum chinense]|nr:hypothetical protein BC332_18894 [Capsicum chinense]
MEVIITDKVKAGVQAYLESLCITIDVNTKSGQGDSITCDITVENGYTIVLTTQASTKIKLFASVQSCGIKELQTSVGGVMDRVDLMEILCLGYADIDLNSIDSQDQPSDAQEELSDVPEELSDVPEEPSDYNSDTTD